MQDLTLEHANTFFFFTTVAVTIGIVILLIVMFICFKMLIFLRKLTARAYEILDKTEGLVDRSTKTNGAVEKSLPFLLPVLGFFFKKNKRKKV